MDKIEKLFRKISKKDRAIIEEVIEILELGKKDGLGVKKIIGTNFFRVRVKNFRIIFHYEYGNITIDGIKTRNENTYKNL